MAPPASPTTRLLYAETVEGEYLRSFRARVLQAGEGFVVLDQTAFHVEGGGQAADHGLLRIGDGEGEAHGGGQAMGEARVVGVRQEGGLVKHLLAPGAAPLAEGQVVEGVLDWERRYALMRGHTSGHLLAKAAWALLNARTVGNSIELDKLRIDVRPARLGPSELKRLEDEVNQAIERDRAVRIRMLDRARLEEGEPGERGLLALSPPDPTLRAIEVEGYDLCPCSGTHVAQTKEVGGVQLLKRESKGQGTDRITYRLVPRAEE
jgi:misacylated tRNA(Ala) deacylase